MNLLNNLFKVFTIDLLLVILNLILAYKINMLSVNNPSFTFALSVLMGIDTKYIFIGYVFLIMGMLFPLITFVLLQLKIAKYMYIDKDSVKLRFELMYKTFITFNLIILLFETIIAYLRLIIIKSRTVLETTSHTDYNILFWKTYIMAFVFSVSLKLPLFIYMSEMTKVRESTPNNFICIKETKKLFIVKLLTFVISIIIDMSFESNFNRFVREQYKIFSFDEFDSLTSGVYGSLFCAMIHGTVIHYSRLG